jgi:transcriptional regulator with XRE-family HTH domain
MAGPFSKFLDSLCPDEPSPGRLMRAFRRRDRLTLDQVSEMTGIEMTRLMSIENGDLELTKDEADLVAAVLKIRPETLL